MNVAAGQTGYPLGMLALSAVLIALAAARASDAPSAAIPAPPSSSPASAPPASTPPPRDGVRPVYWADVRARHVAPPAVPDGLSAPTDCALRVTIDAAGVVTHVDPEDCPGTVLDAARNAALVSTFEPYVVTGRAVPVAFTYRYHFGPSTASPAPVAGWTEVR